MIADVESDDPIAPIGDTLSVYEGAEAQQCLRLSEKLFAARQERDQLANQLKATVLELMEARATIDNLKHHLNGYKK